MDIQLEKKKGLRPKHYGYIAIGLLLLFVGYQLIFSSSVSTFRTEKDKLSLAEITQGKFDDYITINGNVAPIATIYMDAYEGGRVDEKLIEEGAIVKGAWPLPACSLEEEFHWSSLTSPLTSLKPDPHP